MRDRGTHGRREMGTNQTEVEVSLFINNGFHATELLLELGP